MHHAQRCMDACTACASPQCCPLRAARPAHLHTQGEFRLPMRFPWYQLLLRSANRSRFRTLRHQEGLARALAWPPIQRCDPWASWRTLLLQANPSHSHNKAMALPNLLNMSIPSSSWQRWQTACNASQRHASHFPLGEFCPVWVLHVVT